MKIDIKIPNVATIGIAGPVQCGKSIVMLRLAKVLEDEFGAVVVLNDELKTEKNQTTENIADWERRLVASTVWILAE